MTRLGEGIRDARQFWFEKFLLDGIIETLE